MSENITKIFYQEAQDKKRTGRGIYNRASRTGKGKGYMPVDLLSGKAKEEYMGNSEVTRYFINDKGERIDK